MTDPGTHDREAETPGSDNRGEIGVDVAEFTAAGFRRRAEVWRAAHASSPGFAAQPTAAWAGDHAIDAHSARLDPHRPLVDAAVLMPVVDHGNGATVLLTQRTDHLSSHAGQVAFPGGKIDPDDATPEAAALREAEEEIGLTRDFIDPVCDLDVYVSNSGFRITPVLATVRPGFKLTLNPGEVADAFEVPLAFLMAPGNHRRASRIHEGLRRTFYEMPWENRYIWGVTAGILRQVYERLYR